MKHKVDAIENAKRIINQHKANGLSDEDARNAAIVTINDVLNIVRYCAVVTHSLYQRTLNFLMENP